MSQASGTWDEDANDELFTFSLPNSHGSITVSTVCPHYGGPLHFDESTNSFHCPWHGWKFDAASGGCINRKTNVRLRFYDRR